MTNTNYDVSMNVDTIDITQRMLRIWACGTPIDHDLNLSSRRKARLRSLFANVFNSDLGKWEAFVALIGGRHFLQQRFSKQGELFDWATKRENCLVDSAETAERLTDELVEDLLSAGVLQDEITATTQHMLSVWEERIPVLPGEKPFPLHTRRKTTLHVLFAAVFHCDMIRWSKFVDLVLESDFLMGRCGSSNGRGQVSLDWVLKPENCIDILAGAHSNDGTKKPTHLTAAELTLDSEVFCA